MTTSPRWIGHRPILVGDIFLALVVTASLFPWLIGLTPRVDGRVRRA